MSRASLRLRVPRFGNDHGLIRGHLRHLGSLWLSRPKDLRCGEDEAGEYGDLAPSEGHHHSPEKCPFPSLFSRIQLPAPPSTHHWRP